MPIPTFVDFVQDRTGDALRVVTWYTSDTYEIVYARDDIKESALQTRVKSVYRRLATNGGDPDSDPMKALGEEKAMVQVREEAVILHFPMDSDRGVLVSLDAGVARDLHTFVVECLSRLEGNTTPP